MKASARSFAVISSVFLSAMFLSACGAGTEEQSGGLTAEDEEELDAAAARLDSETAIIPPLPSASENAPDAAATEAPAK